MATPLEVIQEGAGRPLLDQDGNETVLELLPPLSAAELAELEATLGPLPSEVRELAAVTRGFDGILETLDLYALRDSLGLEDAFPLAHPIAHDGYGNFWVADVRPGSGSWEGIFYVCHDPPVVVFQTYSLAEFLAEVLRLGNPPWQSAVDEVHEQHAGRIWRENPGFISREECLASGDESLAAFASKLDETHRVVDLREPRTGDGFSWGLSGPNTTIRRHGHQWLFAVSRPPRRKPLLARLFGGRAG
jgi:hypothetical protein